MPKPGLLLTLCCLLTPVAPAQRFTFGVIGGTNLTDNFPIRAYSGPADSVNPAYSFSFGTGGRSVILGLSLEAALPGSFSFEADVLHRPLKSEITFTQFLPAGAITTRQQNVAVRTWEFPLLLKYSLPSTGQFRPFIAAGPSFRTQEDASATEPSQVGISAGVGATMRWRHLRISPTLRYTRWASENIYPRYPTKQDQLEFLTSFGVETGVNALRVGTRHVNLGLIFGLPLTSGFSQFSFDKTPELFRYMAGLTVQLPVKGNFSVEVDGIYKPLRAKSDNLTRSQAFSVLTWQFPVLAKYSLTRTRWSPFLAGGPSFRLSGNLNGYRPSGYGVTVGGGAETRLGPLLRLAPSLRYTRWAGDATPRSLNPHSLELVFGAAF